MAESPDWPVIDVDPTFGDGLDGVADGQKLWVLFWMDRLAAEARGTLRAHPMGDNTAPERGVFSLRSPARPNPLGLTLVEVIRRDGLRLFVRGLDALPGSPVIDLKPWTEKDC